MSRWRKIETAPRDGTPILIWDPTKSDRGRPYDDSRYAIGYWRTDQPDGWKWMWGNRNSSEVSPTHWQPLPNPPKGFRSRTFNHAL